MDPVLINSPLQTVPSIHGWLNVSLGGVQIARVFQNWDGTFRVTTTGERDLIHPGHTFKSQAEALEALRRLLMGIPY